jgi:hypothetical protein
MRNAFAELPWNVQNSSTVPSLDGALWQAWSPEAGTTELYPPSVDFSPPDKNKSIIWLCDSGKAGYMFLRMYELSGSNDTALLRRATLAAEFLLRVQQSDGDFPASIYDAKNAAVVRGPSFAATTSAILLWSKLYEITREVAWLEAAERCAAAVRRNYLRAGQLQIDGGELDNVMTSNHLHANSAGCYGVMGLSALAIVTQNETHIQMVRVIMDYMLAQQWNRDINLGFYFPKFRFQGANSGVAIGASTNGMFRSEITLFPWMAYQATGDPRYLASFKATLAYQSHAQYDNPYDSHFFGGGDEGVFQSYQVINGWGCSFLGETVGQGVGIMEYLLRAEEKRPRTADDAQAWKTDDPRAPDDTERPTQSVPLTDHLRWLSWYTYTSKAYSMGQGLDAAHTSLVMEHNLSRLIAGPPRPTLFGPLDRNLWGKLEMKENIARRRASGKKGAKLQPDISVLPSDWRARLGNTVHALRQWRVGDGGVAGIMLGDELMCRGVPPSNLSSVAGELRQLLPKLVWLWTNECQGVHYNRHPEAKSWVSPFLDVVSVDVYTGVKNKHNPHAIWNASAAAAEAAAARAYYIKRIFPLLAPGQRVAVVPGLFADSTGNHATQDIAMVGKLKGYEAWAAAEPRIVGICPWHWDSFDANFPDTQFRRGAEAFPKLLAEVARLRDTLRGNHSKDSIPVIKSDDSDQGIFADENHEISNALTKVTFMTSATDGWPISIAAIPTTAGGTPVAIALGARSPGSWEIALHNRTDATTLLKVYPSNCSSFSLDNAEVPSELVMIWTKCKPFLGGGAGGDAALRPIVSVKTRWTLKTDSDTLQTTLEAEVTNPEDTPYRLWLARHPRIAIQPLGRNGSDRLARGIIGGIVFGDPIGYREPHTGLRFPLTADADHDANIISVDSLDPGSWTVPVAAYYDTTSETGLYMANDDDAGYMKGTYLEHLEQALGYSVVQFPGGDIYEATKYTSPYSVQLAVLASGADWTVACTKYREQYRKFSWYTGPAGSAANKAVPGRMKTNPLYGDFTTGNGYTAEAFSAPGKKNIPGFNATAVGERVKFLHSFLGRPFPMALMNRFMYDPPTEITVVSGYTPSPAMAEVHALIRSMEVDGHHAVVHSLTEKTAVDTLKDTANCREPCEGAPACDQPPWGARYCNALDPAMLKLNTANEPLMLDTVPAPWWHFGAVYCPAGPANTAAEPRASWAKWFATLSAQIANTLTASGGHAWNEPAAMVGWCFSKNHSHAPGFGTWMSAPSRAAVPSSLRPAVLSRFDRCLFC